MDGFERALFVEAIKVNLDITETSFLKAYEKEGEKDQLDPISTAVMGSFYIGFELALRVVLANPTYASPMLKTLVEKIYKSKDHIEHQEAAGRLLAGIAEERSSSN